MLLCKKHPPNQVVFICQKQGCTQGNILCQQCLSSNPSHRIEHKTMMCSLQDFLTSQNGNTKSVLIPLIGDMLNELERRNKEYSQVVDREMKEIDQDVSQIFKVFFEISERSKLQMKEVIRQDLNTYLDRYTQFKQALQDILSSDQKKKDGNSLFHAIFSKDQDKELPVTEQSLMQIINKNFPLNSLKSDLISSIQGIHEQLQPNSTRSKYKSTSNQQQQLITITCLYGKMMELTNDNITVEDMKKSLFQSGDASLRQSQVMQMYNSTTGFRSVNSHNTHIGVSQQSSQRFHRTNSAPNIVSFTLLEHFPPIPQPIMAILQQIGHLPPPAQDSLLNGFECIGPCQFTDGIVYEGQIQNNGRFGWGRALIASQYYEGYWRSSLPYGFGRLITINGEFYEGMTVNGKAQGKGVFRGNGYYYEGEWVDDQRSGKGVESVDGQYRYEGDFIENKKEGQGQLNDLVNGSVYVGDFINDVLNGQVTIEYSNGDKYWGEVQTVNGTIKRQGRGVYHWKDGRKYEGQYENDIEQGMGLFMWYVCQINSYA